MHGPEATADGVVPGSLVLVLLWSVVSRTSTQPSSGKRGYIRGGTQQATPAVTFNPLIRDGAGSNEQTQLAQ